MQTDVFSRACCVLLLMLAPACGGSKVETPGALSPGISEVPATAPTPAATETTQESSAPEAAAPEPSAPAASETPAPASAPADDANASRNVRYIVSQDGLKVEVIGARFLVKAKPIRTQAGFEIQVSVEASANEDLSLAWPSSGPLAFAASVTRSKASEPERIGDERKGDGEKTLTSGKPLKFSRNWPGKGVRPLANGDVLELDVGLWGLGHSPEDRRAVKQLARVKARVDNWKGSARVEPPPGLVGK
jgi:hypothetical protein